MWTVFLCGIVIGVCVREGFAIAADAREASRLAFLEDADERRKQQERQAALDRLRAMRARDAKIHRLPVRRDGHSRPLGAA